MTKAEKLSAILAAIFVIVCVIAALIPSPSGITPERSADISEIMTGGDGESEDELMPGDTVNINTADLEELCLLPGIGETLGQRIIDCRESDGYYNSVEELADRVDGIGEKTAEEIRIYVAVEDDVS